MNWTENEDGTVSVEFESALEAQLALDQLSNFYRRMEKNASAGKIAVDPERCRSRDRRIRETWYELMEFIGRKSGV